MKLANNITINLQANRSSTDGGDIASMGNPGVEDALGSLLPCMDYTSNVITKVMGGYRLSMQDCRSIRLYA